jgi:hypothetical protein
MSVLNEASHRFFIPGQALPRALHNRFSPEEIKRTTMHSTNKAFECYFEMESDKVRAELVDLPGCNGALSNAIDMRAPDFNPNSAQYLPVMAIREKVFPSDQPILLEGAPAKSTIDFIS